MKKDNYSNSVKKLRKYLIEKDKERQKWARENWFHSGGRLYKLGRIAVPIISIAGIILAIAVSIIHIWTIPDVQKTVNAGRIFNPNGKSDSLIVPFCILVIFSITLLNIAFIRFIKGKFEKSGVLLFVSSFVLFLCMLYRYFADKDIMPTKTGSEGNEQFYFTFVLIPMIIFVFLAIYSLVLVILDYKDKKYYDNLVEKTLKDITPKIENQPMISEEDYKKAIDEYIKKHK